MKRYNGIMSAVRLMRVYEEGQLGVGLKPQSGSSFGGE